MDLTFDQLPKAVSQLALEIGEIKRLLQERVETAQPQADELLTIQQAADFLKLSVATIYGHVHRASLPVCKQNKRLYFSKQELTEWVKSGRKKTYAEIAKEANQYLDKKKKG